MTKSTATIFTEGSLYVIIAAGSPFAEFLISDREVSTRAIVAVSVIALVAAANALKAFLSQSMSSSENAEPQKMLMVNPPGAPANVTEQPKPIEQPNPKDP